MAAPNPVTNTEFARTLGKVLGRPSIVPAPGFAFEMAFGEVATIVVDGQRAVPRKLLDAGYEFKYPELEDALRAIYHPETALATA